MKKTLIISFLWLCVGIGVAVSQTTEVDFNNGAGTLLRDAAGNPLSQGVATLNSDGFLIQLGYFSAGTIASNFAGTFIPLTGFGPAPKTTIGDSQDLTGSGAGRLAFITVFRSGSNVVQVYDPLAGDAGGYFSQSSVIISGTTPPSSQVLAIRFYDTTTGTTGNYNTVSADNWLWSSPTQDGAVVLLNLVTAGTSGNPALEFESFPAFGAAGDFRTVILIPEPSTYALIGLGAVGLMIGYRCRSKAIA